MEHNCGKKAGRLFFIVTILGLLGVSLFVTGASASNPNVFGGIAWNKTYGGAGWDQARSIQQTSDDGYIFVGFSCSDDGDATFNHRRSRPEESWSGGNTTPDYWIVKLNNNGTIDWQKSLGGSTGMDWSEMANSVQQTADGGYIVAGWASSDDGDVTGHHGGSGSDDLWVIKLNSGGDLVWKRCLGGTGWDAAHSISQTSDGGYIVAGYTNTADNGDVYGRHGTNVNKDYWIVKLSSAGTIEWQRCFGGSQDDVAYSARQTTDGGYIIAGYTASNDGDVIGNHGGWDAWVVKLNATGSPPPIDWQRSLGGSSGEYALSIQQTTDGGFIVAGGSGSDDGDVSGTHGGGDYWVVKLNATGSPPAIDWQKCFGGTSSDGYIVINMGPYMQVQEVVFGGYIVAGNTMSYDGDVSRYYGGYYDGWIVRLNETGDLIWEKTLGGSYNDEVKSIQQTIDGGYIVAGDSNSPDGDVGVLQDNYVDAWVVKLNRDNLILGTINPMIGFEANVTGGTVPCAVQFNDTSYLSPNWWYWEFGDGAYSLDQNPVHVYTHPGRYNVSLAVRNLTGQNWTEKIQFITVTNVPFAPVANFTANCTSGPLQFLVQFTDTSDCLNPLEWTWSFGDGTSFITADPLLRNATHLYTRRGTFSPALTIRNASGSDTKVWLGYILVTMARPVPNWSSNLSYGPLPMIVEFSDTTLCLNPWSWYWEFGDGSSSTSQNPVHTYLVPGNYTVSLSVTNASGNGTTSRADLISVFPRGDFNANNRADISDLTRVAYMAAYLIPTDYRADFNNDGIVDIGDASRIAWYYVGKIDNLVPPPVGGGD
jgi:PKD repeat protein